MFFKSNLFFTYYKMSTLKSPIVSYIFTHNARMRCLVRKIMEPLYIEYPDDNFSESERETIDTRDYYSAYSDRGSDEDDRDDIELFQPPVGTYTPLPISESDNLETEPLIIPEQASRSSSSESKKSALNRKSKYVQNHANIGVSNDAVWGESGMPRFKNGSVLEIMVTKEDIHLRLVVGGEIDEQKPKYTYFVKPGEAHRDINHLRGRYQVEEFLPLSFPNTLYPEVGTKTYKFYLIRHGQGTHNLKGTNLTQDTSLTEEGKLQAKELGIKLRGYITNTMRGDIDLPNFIFISDLKRTKQTAEEVLKELLYEDATQIPPYGRDRDGDPPTQVYILPCSHELSYKSDGICDGKQGIPPPENMTTCSRSNPECLTLNKYDVNWDYYYDFYGNATRSQVCKAMSPCSHQKCRNTDMIKEAINIINKETLIGGKRKTKKAAKGRKSKKSKKYKKTKKSKKNNKTKKTPKRKRVI